MSLNRYNYVAGNPTNLVDPSGMIAERLEEWDICSKPQPQQRSGSCKVEVASYPVNLPILPDVAHHIFIIYTNASGQEVVYRGGRGSSGEVLAETQAPTDNDLTKLGQSGNPRHTLLSGPEACGVNICFDEEIERINNTNTPYCTMGPTNSNAVASTLLQRCGVAVEKPPYTDWAPGWRNADFIDDTDVKCLVGLMPQPPSIPLPPIRVIADFDTFFPILP